MLFISSTITRWRHLFQTGFKFSRAMLRLQGRALYQWKARCKEHLLCVLTGGRTMARNGFTGDGPCPIFLRLGRGVKFLTRTMEKSTKQELSPLEAKNPQNVQKCCLFLPVQLLLDGATCTKRVSNFLGPCFGYRVGPYINGKPVARCIFYVK